jgi:integrase
MSGTIYSGVCEDCEIKEKAAAFENSERDIIRGSLEYGRKVKKAQKIAAHVRETVLAGVAGKKIPLADAFEIASKKPRKKTPGEDYQKQKCSHWRDFISYIASEHSTVKYISDVETIHAEGYIGYIRESGRFDKEVKNGGVAGEYTRNYNLSAASANLMLTTLKETFKLLKKDTGMEENPFSGIEKADNSGAAAREIFTEDELNKIFDNADEFLYPIFRIGLETALREGDVCLLKWANVNLFNKTIQKKTRKTGAPIEIPMLKELYDYMLELKQLSNGSEYVLPAQAELYLKSRTTLCNKIKIFLKNIGIQTTAKAEGRDRLVSVKDFHSLRHTFCYIAGKKGIPLSIVQAIVGHMTPEMTQHYQKHADLADKRKALEQMPDFMRGGVSSALLVAGNSKKDRIIKLMENATEDQLDKILIFLER